MAYISFRENLDRISLITEEVSKSSLEASKVIPFALSFDKAILRNNTTVPFLVAAMESFLKDFFIAYVDFQPNIQEKVFDKKAKLDYSQLKEILKKKKSLGELEAENYTFQNLLSANVAYRTFIDLDIFDILNQQIEYKDANYTIREVISKMLELRHNIIHSAHIDPTLGKEKIDKYVFFLQSFASLFVQKFFSERDFRVDLEEHI